jgi:hypothetical protein
LRFWMAVSALLQKQAFVLVLKFNRDGSVSCRLCPAAQHTVGSNHSRLNGLLVPLVSGIGAFEALAEVSLRTGQNSLPQWMTNNGTL